MVSEKTFKSYDMFTSAFLADMKKIDTYSVSDCDIILAATNATMELGQHICEVTALLDRNKE